MPTPPTFPEDPDYEDNTSSSSALESSLVDAAIDEFEYKQTLHDEAREFGGIGPCQ